MKKVRRGHLRSSSVVHQDRGDPGVRSTGARTSVRRRGAHSGLANRQARATASPSLQLVVVVVVVMEFQYNMKRAIPVN